ncbi:PepSY domain-containing protein [Robiginitalea biformata]|uniref:PepSY domain-containing protein n=1 Tax=Robiginitalea biformata TaxID=252307 RepID=UPI003B597DC1
MTLSLWRYSHLALAVATSAFLLIASVTGVILALEPITHQARGYAVADLDEVPLSTALEALTANYEEVFTLEVERSGFVRAGVLTADLESLEVYVNPRTGETLGPVEERPAIYSFSTNLHRSLFLKGAGRFFVGLVSLLLCIIAVSGIVLLAQRQGGFRRILSPVRKDYFAMRYHVLLSRWILVPILVVALTGVYLSAEKFRLLPEALPQHREVAAPPTGEGSGPAMSTGAPGQAGVLGEWALSEVRRVEFPFSDEPGEYYLIELKDREVRVSPMTGAILSEADFPMVTLLSRFSFAAHTGQGNVFWSIVLLLASASILFFMYSGFAMTLRRRKNTRVRKGGSHGAAMSDADSCEVAVLVGSETGTTFGFARSLCEGIRATGRTVHLAEMNAYRTYPKARQLVVLTATYGDGEAPTNARRFLSKVDRVEQPAALQFSVVGFGSTQYPDFCRYASDVQEKLEAHPGFRAGLPLYRVDDQSEADFRTWLNAWGDRTGIRVGFEAPAEPEPLDEIGFTVVSRSPVNADDTFLLTLRPETDQPFTSGDLLAVRPDKASGYRQYSIAYMEGDIVLSIRRHPGGRCSSYLYSLQAGDRIAAAIQENPGFHFPGHVRSAVMIANGTGIAPFLGMMQQTNGTDVHLFWGGRTRESGKLYSPWLKQLQDPEGPPAAGTPNFSQGGPNIRTCYSREGAKRYVQDLVLEDRETVLHTLREGGVLMLCGSLNMQRGVLDNLESLLEAEEGMTLDGYIERGQLLMDCY